MSSTYITFLLLINEDLNTEYLIKVLCVFFFTTVALAIFDFFYFKKVNKKDKLN